MITLLSDSPQIPAYGMHLPMCMHAQVAGMLPHTALIHSPTFGELRRTQQHVQPPSQQAGAVPGVHPHERLLKVKYCSSHHCSTTCVYCCRSSGSIPSHGTCTAGRRPSKGVDIVRSWVSKSSGARPRHEPVQQGQVHISQVAPSIEHCHIACPMFPMVYPQHIALHSAPVQQGPGIFKMYCPSARHSSPYQVWRLVVQTVHPQRIALHNITGDVSGRCWLLHSQGAAPQPGQICL
jgi:hypothetical protein